MINVRQFDHVNLNVRDVERSVRFYKDVLGLPLVRRDVDANGKTTFVAVKAGPQIVDMRPKAAFDPPDQGSPGYNHLALEVEPMDPDALVAYLKEKGVEIQRGPVQNKGAKGMGTAIYFYDPDRYVVELKWYQLGTMEVAPLEA